MIRKNILNFIFELGQLRRIKHEGWRIAGVDHPESVAEHSLRAAQIGFLLASIEKHPHPAEIATMLIFHDIGECRIGDIHKVANRYIKADEKKAVQDQLKKLDQTGKKIYKIWEQIEKHNTSAGIIAKDADLLEQAVIAKEYLEKGHKFTQDWINNIAKKLKTKSAKNLLKTLQKTSCHDWWQGLKKID